jgi:hypothetical protein
VNWLEKPQDGTERFLRDALNHALKRVPDEITHRRVWAKIANVDAQPQRRPIGRILLAGAAFSALLMGGIWAYSNFGMPETLVTTLPPPPSTASPVVARPPLDLVETARLPGQIVRSGAGEKRRVALGGGAEAVLSENSAVSWDSHRRPMVKEGKATLSVPHQPPGWRFSVTAGPYVITVVGTKFDVHVRSQTVLVRVTEGIVEVGRGAEAQRLIAGDTWEGPLAIDPIRGAPPKPTPANSRPKLASVSQPDLVTAQAALQSGSPHRAVEILSMLAHGSGPTAENAAYQIALITRDNLHRPRQAIALWDKYRRQFPSGILRKEADLSIVDTLSRLKDHSATLREAEAFLARHPDSERKAEIQELVTRLRASGMDGVLE